MIVKGTLAFAGGIILLQHLPTLPPAWLIYFGPSALAASFLIKYPLPRLFGYAMLGFLWALFQAQTLLSQRIPESFIKQDVQVLGTIASLPEPFEQGVRFELAIKECVDPVIVRCPERVRLSWYRPPAVTLQPGQTWRFTVRLKPSRSFANPGSFDYSGWLLQKGIIHTGYINSRAAFDLLGQDWRNAPVQLTRYRLQQFLIQHLDDLPAEALVRALLIGDRSGMQSAQWQVLQRTGTVHLMAISGLHVGLIAGFGFLLTHWLWRRSTRLCLGLAAPRAAAIVAWVLALVYAALAGFAIPTQRALIMLAVVLLAVFLRRPVRPVNVLCTALLLVLLHDPFAVLAVGFWLSFAAVALIYYLLALQPAQQARLRRWLRLQVAISLGLLPLVVLFFQQAPILSPLTNLVAIPWVSFIVVPLAMLSLIASYLHTGLGVAGLKLASMAMQGLYELLSRTAELPLSIIYLPAPNATVMLLALAGIALLLLPRHMPARYLGLLLCLPLVLPLNARPAHGEAEVILLDVGQGLATVVMTRAHTLVFDTGPAFSERFDTGEAVVIPYLRTRGVRDLDMLIVSHGDLDHIGGAASVQAAMPVRQVLSSVPARLGEGATFCSREQRWEWDGVVFDILHPAQDGAHDARHNDQSCVLRITAGQHAILLTGDIETAAELALVQHYAHDLHSDVLVVPHHGSKTSSSERFLDHVQPDIALFPVGWLNRYRHPHPDILARYVLRGIRLYDTAQHGAIHVRLGDGLEVETFRAQTRRYWHVP